MKEKQCCQIKLLSFEIEPKPIFWVISGVLFGFGTHQEAQLSAEY